MVVRVKRACAGVFGAGLLAGMAAFALPLVSPAQTPTPWSGVWDTTFGSMTLTQSGRSVKGSYDHDGGRLSGTVSGDVLSARWDETPTRAGPRDAGSLQFTLAPDGRSFTGTWRYDGDEPSVSRSWNGTATGALPPPVLGRALNVAVVSGEVRIAVPASGSASGTAEASQKGLRFVPLTEARQVPIGSVLDTRRGTVRVVTARDRAGTTQAGRFTAGVFQVLQSRARRTKGLTNLRLKGSSFKRCSAVRGAHTSAARKIRRLRANARGRFRTRGRHSATTVRGTVWTTIDRCDGTLTTVARGKVAVRDFRRKKTIIVRAGKRYLAKAR